VKLLSSGAAPQKKVKPGEIDWETPCGRYDFRSLAFLAAAALQARGRDRLEKPQAPTSTCCADAWHPVLAFNAKDGESRSGPQGVSQSISPGFTFFAGRRQSLTASPRDLAALSPESQA